MFMSVDCVSNSSISLTESCRSLGIGLSHFKADLKMRKLLKGVTLIIKLDRLSQIP